MRPVFLILHYGSHKVTETCIESILNMDYSCDYTVLIADNDAGPSSWNLYKDNPRIRVISTGNTGFSAANNAAYSYARENLDPDMIIACNNDLVFNRDGFGEDKLELLLGTDAYAVGPDIEKISTGEHQSPIATKLPDIKAAKRTLFLNKFLLAFYPVLYLHFRTLVRGKTQLGVSVTGTEDIIVPFGACIIFTRRFIEKEDKLFTPETRFYYEEFILAKRFKDKGYKIFYEPSLHVLHEDGAASKASFKADYLRLKRKVQNTRDACEVYLHYIEQGK